MTDLLSIEEAARRLSCSQAAIRKWLAQRRVRAVRLGRLVRLRSADVERIATEGLPDRPD